MVSVICCYNDEKLYKNMEKSLSMQSVEYELIGINNKDNIFTSAASALNSGAEQSNGDLLVFIHQDIVFENKNSLKNFTSALDKYNNIIIGLFGAAKNKEKIDDNLYKVQTLDECCVAMSKNIWKKLKFNDTVCDNWHLYVVEMCLRAAESGIIIATGKYDIKHLSSGTVNIQYMKTFKDLLIIYKDKKWIYTTCKSMPTNLFFYYLYYCFWKLKKMFFGNAIIMYNLKRKLIKNS